MITKKPKISIVTVVYNGKDTIERTIKSVIEQGYDNIEYIIIDGASTDGTLEIINKYIQHISYFQSKKDKGIYDAMNQGIENATGDYIGMLNADDWLEPNSIDIVVDNIVKNKEIDIFHGNINYVQGAVTRVIKPTKNLQDFFWKGMSYMHPTFYVKQKVYNELKYDLNYKLLSDYKFTMESIKRGYSFYHIDQVIVNYSADGASAAFWARIKEGHNIRLDLNYPKYKTYLSSSVRISLTLASLLKYKIKNITQG